MRRVAFIGWSGSGKTTLLEKLLPRMAQGGRTVGYMKTDAHGFTMDRPGKDTARLFDAGANLVPAFTFGRAHVAGLVPIRKGQIGVFGLKL